MSLPSVTIYKRSLTATDDILILSPPSKANACFSSPMVELVLLEGSPSWGWYVSRGVFTDVELVAARLEMFRMNISTPPSLKFIPSLSWWYESTVVS